MFAEPWSAEVTDADVRAAQLDWLAARDSGATPDRLATLFGDLQQVMGAQAQQIAEDFRAERALRQMIADRSGEA